MTIPYCHRLGLATAVPLIILLEYISKTESLTVFIDLPYKEGNTFSVCCAFAPVAKAGAMTIRTITLLVVW